MRCSRHRFVWVHLREVCVCVCARGWSLNPRVCAQTLVFVCATELEESTLISVSLESVIEHEPFRRRVEAVTLCNNTRGDKKGRSLILSQIFPALCLYPGLSLLLLFFISTTWSEYLLAFTALWVFFNISTNLPFINNTMCRDLANQIDSCEN